MRTAILAVGLAGLLGSACAQDGLPNCAQSCLTPYISGSSIAGCSSLDISCICASSTFLSGIACCLASSCSAADQKTATSYALNLCAANGVTNLPTAVSCTSTAASTASAASSAGTANSAISTTSRATTTGTTASGTSKSSTASATGAATSKSSAAFAAPTNVAGMWEVIGGLAAVAALL